MGSSRAEEALWTRVRGDDWRWEYTTDEDVTGWSSPLVQIRRGRSQTDPLIATSSTAESVTANITVVSDFGSGELSWLVDNLVTKDIPDRFYWLEVSALVGGDRRTVLTHKLTVQPQIAVEV